MVPEDLQLGLMNRVKSIFISDTFPNSIKTDATLSVFEQHLPEKDKKDVSYYPYVLVQISDGEQIGQTTQHTTKLLFVIGVYDEGRDNQGHKQVMKIINKIFDNLRKDPTEGGKYELNFPIRWGLHEEDTAPYYFGAVETNWSVPTFGREDVEALI